jgi:two-component system, sensor histidine kinase and response regulator
MLGSALKSLGVRAHVKGIELVWRCSEDVPAFVVGDAGRLRQIIFNLAGNAIKFTHQGEVLLSVRKLTENGFSTRLEFSITDSGIGIAPENQNKIFDAFQQADSSTTRKFGGTGLGLAIARRLVELFGGDIEVESTLGKGSVFRFTANFGRDTCIGPEPVVDTAHFQNTHVLVVDDNATNRRILVEVLAGWGLTVHACESGQDAICYLTTSFAATTTPVPPVSLVITDYNMPEMDGFMLASKIRQEERFQNVKIILLSSSVGLTHKDFDGLQISAFLCKPIKQSELFEALTSVICAKPLSTSLPTPVPLEPMRPLKILLAEDGLANQKLATGLLTRWGHSVTVVVNGSEAIKAWENGDFDVILMDVQMPIMDGLQATQAIRAKELGSEKQIPIIALTAHAMTGDRQKCLDAGMNGYVTKPFKKQSLYETLSVLIN